MGTSNPEPDVGSPLKSGSDDVERGSDGPHLRVKDYRRLAICSIICGLSCVGIVSLIYSVKTREIVKKSRGAAATLRAEEYSKKTLRWGVGAFLALLGLLIVIPLLLGLLSYLLTFIN